MVKLRRTSQNSLEHPNSWGLQYRPKREHMNENEHNNSDMEKDSLRSWASSNVLHVFLHVVDSCSAHIIPIEKFTNVETVLLLPNMTITL